MSTATEPITLNVPPLDRSRHAAPQVFEHLRELIIGVRLVPGTVLNLGAGYMCVRGAISQVLSFSTLMPNNMKCSLVNSNESLSMI